MLFLPLILVFGPLLLACGGGAGDCDATDLAEGAVEATIDGAAWVVEGAQWSWAADAAQVSTAEAEGWRFTLVAATDAAGDPLSQVLGEEGEIPVELGEGSFIAAYPTGVSGSYAANDAGEGSLVVERVGEALGVCFSATATASDGSTIELADGRLLAACAGDCG